MSRGIITANEAWQKLIDKYDIVNKVAKDGIFHIKASEIKEFKEPRLMAKWDCTAALPSVFKSNDLNILPDSRNSYVLGDFLLYKEIPELTEAVNKMDYVELPEYETIDVNNISSEANAINVLILSGILDDFLEDEGTVETFNGRMGTGEFDFVLRIVTDSTEGLDEVYKVVKGFEGVEKTETHIVLRTLKEEGALLPD